MTDARIEAFLADVLAVEGEKPDAIQDGVHVTLADSEQIFNAEGQGSPRLPRPHCLRNATSEGDGDRPEGVWDRLLQQHLLLLQMPMPKPSASCAAKFARLLQLALLRQRSAGGPVAAEFLTLVTTSDNTNSTAATSGQSLHTRRCCPIIIAPPKEATASGP